MRTVLLAFALSLFVISSANAQTTVAYVDLQGSVQGGWPSALNGKTISQTVVLKNTTNYQSFDINWSSINPANWPSPNDRGGTVQAGVGHTLQARSIKADHDPQILIGSNGKKYGVYLAGDVIVSKTLAAGEAGSYVNMAMTITLKTKTEQPDNTDSTPQDGDANKDGDVDWFDMKVIEDNFGTSSGASWSDGDFNGDGDVDWSDYLAAVANFTAW